MRVNWKVWLVILNVVWGEGTRELMNNNCANHGYIQIWDNNDPLRDFATYNCPEQSRLYIRVAGGERIYMGFHVNGGADSPPTIYTDVWMRLRDPNGNIVLGPVQLTNTMAAGGISTCNQALTGPSALYAGGYNALVYTVPVGSGGNYFIEFAVNNNPTVRQKRVFRWFDITVARWNGSQWIERKGRLWSRKWDFTTRGATNAFVGTLYTYSSDSVVTSFAFNGMRPYGFEVSCNSFGASNIGTPTQRRRSDYRQNIINAGGIPAAPEYPVFLNDPDQEFYPTGLVASVDSFSIIPCTQTSYCLYVSLSKPGQVSITLNFPAPYVPRTFIQNLNSGPNCIPWDGTDGNGTPLPNHTTVNAKLEFFTGLTHLPLVDVEYHNNGFRVFLVRPTTRPNGTLLPDPRIYWDDALLTDPANSLDGVQNFTGCQPTPALGCHRWQNRGVNNANPEVINTWWYTNSEEHTFVLDIDPNKWRVFSEITSCTGPNGIQVHLWFWHEIPFSSLNWNITTTPANLLGPASDTLIDTSNPQWTHVWLTFPVTNNGNAVTISFSLTSSSTKYPYCQGQTTLFCTVLPILWGQELRGSVQAGYNLLEWSTIVEQSIQGFWIERALPGSSFEPIRFVTAQGHPSLYTVRDEAPPVAPRWLYRLRVEEPGMPPVYSRTIELIAESIPPSVWIEPSSRTLFVSSSDSKPVQIEIFTSVGQLVWSERVQPGSYLLPLTPGAYLVRAGEKTQRIFLP
ncbi:MAG: hypothetical protein N2170_06505 [Bacteroidia bacterium]|nr:hypothetical protein [Bacteroidia bacterium]